MAEEPETTFLPTSSPPPSPPASPEKSSEGTFKPQSQVSFFEDCLFLSLSLSLYFFSPFLPIKIQFQIVLLCLFVFQSPILVRGQEFCVAGFFSFRLSQTQTNCDLSMKLGQDVQFLRDSFIESSPYPLPLSFFWLSPISFLVEETPRDLTEPLSCQVRWAVLELDLCNFFFL